MVQPTVAVIIASYNASETISRSVRSALSQGLVSEVVVVDDCSTDETIAVANAAAGGDERFKLLRQPRNLGPSAARNRAIEESVADVIAILDADDAFLKGRLEPMLRAPDWDMCADNVFFVTSADDIPVTSLPASPAGVPPVTIDTAGFVKGNISSPANFRGELGFLKPIIRRELLLQHGVRYAEQCRLGEDFLLYFELLARGARFKLLPECGYAGLIRNNSLSGRHRLEDLDALFQESLRLQDVLSVSPDVRYEIKRHTEQLKRKINKRRAISVRHEKGLLSGLTYAALHPTATLSLLRDKVTNSNLRETPSKRLLADQDYQRLYSDQAHLQ